MKTLILAAALAFAPVAAHAVDVVPLEKFLATADMNDVPTEQYLYERCAGIYNAISGSLKGETGPDRVAARDHLVSRTQLYLGLAIQVENSFAQYDDAQKRYDMTTAIPKAIVQMSDNYVDLMMAARAKAGDFWTDTTVKGDYVFCGGFGK